MSGWGRPRAAGAAIFLPLLLVALSITAIAPSYVNHDAAWYLYMVDRRFAGATLYRDIIDTNPPLIVWLSSVPVALARWTGLSATAMFKTYVFVVAAFSVVAARAVVRRTWPNREFVLVAAATFLCLPFVKTDFGQREHFAVLLTLPYVLAAAAIAEGHGDGPRGMRLAIGAAAGAGFAIKPHFLAAWIGVEAVVVAARGVRSLRRPEFAAALVALVAYGLAVAILTPAYLTIADHVRRVYQGLDSPPSVLLRLREVQLGLAAAALFAAVRWPRAERLPAVAFAAGAGYLAAALLQFKGWGYQLYPARVWLLLFLAAAALVMLDALPSALALLRGGRRGLAIVFAAVLGVASMRYIAEARRPASPDLATPFIEAIRAHAPQGPVAVLSMRTIIYPAFPAVNYTDAAWSLRHNSLWFLPGFYADQDRAGAGPLQRHRIDAMPALERMFFDQIVDDLCAAPPRLLAIEEANPAAPAGRRALDLRAYYAQSAAAAALLADYRPVGPLGPFTMFTATDARCDVDLR
jgi:hypothetical protein